MLQAFDEMAFLQQGKAMWTRFAIVALLVSLASMAHSKDHVLILTISNYAHKPLLGVKHDASNALQIAQRLGYDISNATVLKDDQLNQAGMLRAIQDLPNHVRAGDRVFFYYSGHGASLLQGNQCVQTLVAKDESLIDLSALSAIFDKIKTLTSNVVVILDACHSGGFKDLSITRALNADSPIISSKAWNPRKGEHCYSPSNFAKGWNVRSDMPVTRSMQLPQSNFVFIAAAKENEVALDDSSKGGLATLGLLDCTNKPVRDTDSSGVVSAAELAACAQNFVAQEVPRLNERTGQRYTAPTIEVSGNSNRPLNLMLMPPSTQEGSTHIAAHAQNVFEQIVQGANANWQLRIKMPQKVSIGSGAIVQYSTNHPGYLSIFYIGSDNKDISALADNLKIDQTLPNEFKIIGTIPITAPSGKNTFLFYMAKSQINKLKILNAAKTTQAVNSNEFTSYQIHQLLTHHESKSEVVPGINRNAMQLIAQDNHQKISGYAASIDSTIGE